jgi:hypothetical protein
MKQVIGYILTLIGIGVLALGIKPVQTALSLQPPAFLSPVLLMILGIVLALLGVFLIKKASATQSPEVPIYEGQNIVGYRKVN